MTGKNLSFMGGETFSGKGRLKILFYFDIQHIIRLFTGAKMDSARLLLSTDDSLILGFAPTCRSLEIYLNLSQSPNVMAGIFPAGVFCWT